MYLPHDLRLGSLPAKHETGDAHRDEKQRCEREKRVERQGSPEARAFMPIPFSKAFAQQRFDVAPPKGCERLAIPARPSCRGGNLRAAGFKNLRARYRHLSYKTRRAPGVFPKRVPVPCDWLRHLLTILSPGAGRSSLFE